jgi:hypothetical protein
MAHRKSSTHTKLEVLQKQQEKLKRKLQKPQIHHQWVTSQPTDTTTAAIFSMDIDAPTTNK